MSIPCLLVVDDDSEMRSMMVEFIQQNGFSAFPADSESTIKAQLQAGRIDLILLDVMLGEQSGIDICAQLRRDNDIPIIMISALSSDQDRMVGYDVGADDYITKPFNPELLVARIKAVLQRAHRTASLSYRRKIQSYRFNDWSYDGKQNEVRAPSGYQVALSRRESTLLKLFLANPHIPLTRDEISSELDNQHEDERSVQNTSRSIDVLVGRLRSKIEADPKGPQMIRTERGVGYVFCADVDVAT